MINLRKKIESNKGITLIALVITIVVLIILAAVAINLSLGNNGIFNRAKTAKEQYQNAEDYEKLEIEKEVNRIDEHICVSNRQNIQITTEELWTGTAYSGNMTLKESYKNYDELLFFYGNRNAKSQVTEATLHLSTLDWLRANNYSHRLLWYSNEYIEFIVTNDITFTIGGNNVAGIFRIVGIKY